MVQVIVLFSLNTTSAVIICENMLSSWNFQKYLIIKNSGSSISHFTHVNADTFSFFLQQIYFFINMTKI